MWHARPRQYELKRHFVSFAESSLQATRKAQEVSKQIRYRDRPSVLFFVTSLKLATHGLRLPEDLNGDEWEVALHSSVTMTHFDDVFAFWEVHVIGHDRSGIQRRFMPNASIHRDAKSLTGLIETEFRRRYAGKPPRGFFFARSMISVVGLRHNQSFIGARR